jgi:hypothetical protein
VVAILCPDGTNLDKAMPSPAGVVPAAKALVRTITLSLGCSLIVLSGDSDVMMCAFGGNCLGEFLIQARAKQNQKAFVCR